MMSTSFHPQTVGRSVKEDYPDFGGHATGMRPGS